MVPLVTRCCPAVCAPSCATGATYRERFDCRLLRFPKLFAAWKARATSSSREHALRTFAGIHAAPLLAIDVAVPHRGVPTSATRLPAREILRSPCREDEHSRHVVSVASFVGDQEHDRAFRVTSPCYPQRGDRPREGNSARKRAALRALGCRARCSDSTPVERRRAY